VIELEGKTKILMISAAVLTILSAIAAMVYANGTGNATSTTADFAYDYGNYFHGTEGPLGGHGNRGGCGPGGFGGPVTVSQEYKDNVINIAKNDTDVQELIAEGYNITDVRPIISSTVEADGTVTTKAATAIVTMDLNTTGRAFVKVDVTQAKVTRIEIFTRTVIEKPQSASQQASKTLTFAFFERNLLLFCESQSETLFHITKREVSIGKLVWVWGKVLSHTISAEAS